MCLPTWKVVTNPWQEGPASHIVSVICDVCDQEITINLAVFSHAIYLREDKKNFMRYADMDQCYLCKSLMDVYIVGLDVEARIKRI